MKLVRKYGIKPVNKIASRKRLKIVLGKDGKYEESKKLLYEDNATIPDQSLKIRDIVDRFTRGLPVNTQTKRGVFPDEVSHDSPDIDSLGRMDRMDKMDFVRSARINRKKVVDPPDPKEPQAPQKDADPPKPAG